MFSRKQYLNGECTHRQYYAQFVTAATLEVVDRMIGTEKLLNSRDIRLNDIPLKEWDRLPIYFRSTVMEECGDYLTASSKVCILKEAAHQLLDELLNSKNLLGERIGKFQVCVPRIPKYHKIPPPRITEGHRRKGVWKC